eukprot:8349967-Alexandrium_andersonii.AAC.1
MATTSSLAVEAASPERTRSTAMAPPQASGPSRRHLSGNAAAGRFSPVTSALHRRGSRLPRGQPSICADVG